MKLSPKALGIASAVLWGGAILLSGIANLLWPPYAAEFLKLASSIYPGFHASRTFTDVLVGTGYAVLDGGAGGVVLAWLYNIVAPRTA
ncbi:MAG TPA: hypothetical protein VMH85_17470 [Terriglobales bacterium]|nr:hypothetical protein [Terriglobales bacterium]